jgi:hypothetical protein
MAQKRINDLQLRSSFDETCNFPSDDLVQTWRVSGAQVKSFIEGNASFGNTNLVDGAVTRSKLAAGSTARLNIDTVTGTHNADGSKDLLLANSSGGSVTVNLPAAALHTGRVITIKKTSASNLVTIDGDSAETIDGETTQVLTENYQSLTIVSNGTGWSIL